MAALLKYSLLSVMCAGQDTVPDVESPGAEVTDVMICCKPSKNSRLQRQLRGPGGTLMRMREAVLRCKAVVQPLFAAS